MHTCLFADAHAVMLQVSGLTPAHTAAQLVASPGITRLFADTLKCIGASQKQYIDWKGECCITIPRNGG